MEDSLASQLPEADALPDGFSESFSANSEYANSAVESELKPSLGQEDKVELDGLNSISQLTVQESETVSSLYSDSSVETAASMQKTTEFCIGTGTERPISESRVEKTQKARTFPVPLSDKDGGDSHDVAESELEKKEVKVLQYMTEQDTNEDLRSLKQGGTSKMKVKQSKGTSKIERELVDSHQKYQQVVIERDNALVELRKNIAVREKLESLCRELQRQNKMLTDECKKVSTEGQQKRLELSTRFHEAIKDVSNKLEEQRDERLSQLKENEMLREKLKQFSEQYEICEQQFMQQLKKKSLELQLAEVKLQQQQEASSQEQSKMRLYTEQITQLLETEKKFAVAASS